MLLPGAKASTRRGYCALVGITPSSWCDTSISCAQYWCSLPQRVQRETVLGSIDAYSGSRLRR